MKFMIKLCKAYRAGGPITRRTDPRYIFIKKMEKIWNNRFKVVNAAVEAIILSVTMMATVVAVVTIGCLI